MKLMNTIFSFLCLSLLVFCSLPAKEDYRVENQPLAIEKAINLPNEGVLKQKKNGFIYVDVSNEFIKSVVPLIDISGEFRALPTAARSLGAHISVFNEKDNIIPEELNSLVSFNVKEIRSFTLHTRDGLKKLWVIAVNSPELEKLREKYGCSPKLGGNDFHITLGKQMPSAPENWETVDALSSFNFSDEPVFELANEGDFVTVEHEQVLATAAKVDAVGQLKLKGNGFVYLDVNNHYIDGIWPKLTFQGEFEPVSTKPKKMGAHISVIHEDEMIGREIWNLIQAGEWFSFEVKELRYVDRKTSKGQTRLWLLAADSPALQRLRLYYGLKPKLKGHDFHITIGNENLNSSSKEQVEELFEEEIMELEEAMSAA